MFALTDEKMGEKFYINSPKKIAWENDTAFRVKSSVQSHRLIWFSSPLPLKRALSTSLCKDERTFIF